MQKAPAETAAIILQVLIIYNGFSETASLIS